jgi:hypothetical protein
MLSKDGKKQRSWITLKRKEIYPILPILLILPTDGD